MNNRYACKIDFPWKILKIGIRNDIKAIMCVRFVWWTAGCNNFGVKLRESKRGNERV